MILPKHRLYCLKSGLPQSLNEIRQSWCEEGKLFFYVTIMLLCCLSHQFETVTELRLLAKNLDMIQTMKIPGKYLIMLRSALNNLQGLLLLLLLLITNFLRNLNRMN